ncbi:hypothetical protein Csa_006589 [Cucumis sativus]|uniref:Uncharacterized protein n=1 Tax=Cucumis sativus TaxID=3659 RepID=A0A0A0LMC4_CUCSA|nr:hypothetical protein Csa_006589 [Cucumis sativus]
MEEESGRYLREGNRRSEGKTERVGLRSDEPSRRVAVPDVAAFTIIPHKEAAPNYLASLVLLEKSKFGWFCRSNTDYVLPISAIEKKLQALYVYFASPFFSSFMYTTDFSPSFDKFFILQPWMRKILA